MVAAVAGPLVQFLGDVVFFAPLLVVAEATAHRQSDLVLRQHYNHVLFALFGFGVPVMPAVVALAVLVGGLLVFFVALLLLVVVVHFPVHVDLLFAVVEATARRQ